MRRAGDLVCLLWASLAATGCVGTTGSDLVTFDAAAAGPADATGGPYELTSGRGFHVVLTKATLHVGAVYLNRARPISGSQATDCVLPGIYVAEVTQGIDINVLSPTPQPFPGKGEGTADRAIVGEVWLTHVDINAPDDPDTILDLAGTADRNGASFPFAGKITIGQNRAKPVADPSMPSADPICQQRIVSPITIDITPRKGGSLLLRIDPSGWFTNVDFSQLTTMLPNSTVYAFEDSSPDPDPPSINLYSGIHHDSGVYDFTWNDSPNP